MTARLPVEALPLIPRQSCSGRRFAEAGGSTFGIGCKGRPSSGSCGLDDAAADGEDADGGCPDGVVDRTRPERSQQRHRDAQRAQTVSGPWHTQSLRGSDRTSLPVKINKNWPTGLVLDSQLSPPSDRRRLVRALRGEICAGAGAAREAKSWRAPQAAASEQLRVAPLALIRITTESAGTWWPTTTPSPSSRATCSPRAGAVRANSAYSGCSYFRQHISRPQAPEIFSGFGGRSAPWPSAG